MKKNELVSPTLRLLLKRASIALAIIVVGEDSLKPWVHLSQIIIDADSWPQPFHPVQTCLEYNHWYLGELPCLSLLLKCQPLFKSHSMLSMHVMHAEQ